MRVLPSFPVSTRHLAGYVVKAARPRPKPLPPPPPVRHRLLYPVFSPDRALNSGQGLDGPADLYKYNFPRQFPTVATSKVTSSGVTCDSLFQSFPQIQISLSLLNSNPNPLRDAFLAILVLYGPSALIFTLLALYGWAIEKDADVCRYMEGPDEIGDYRSPEDMQGQRGEERDHAEQLRKWIQTRAMRFELEHRRRIVERIQSIQDLMGPVPSPMMHIHYA